MNFLRRVRDSKHKEEDTKRFLIFITQLEPAHVFGIAKILGVDLKTFQDDETEKGELLLELMIDKFSSMNKTRRSNLLRLIEEAILEAAQPDSMQKAAGDEIIETKSEQEVGNNG